MQLAVFVICVLVVESSPKYETRQPSKTDVKNVENNNLTDKEMQTRDLTYVNETEEMTRQSVFQETQNASKESWKFKNLSDSVIQNETYSQSPHFKTINELSFQSTDALISNIDHNSSVFAENQNQFPDIQLNRSANQGNIHHTNKDSTLSAEISLTTQGRSEQKETLYPNIPYHIENGADKIHTFTLNRKKILLQHHLQLVPMEDEPLGAMMFKDQRYFVSVLIPIGIGMVGAAMIVVTVFTLRYVARKRTLQSPLDNETEVDGSNTPCISSISTETTDKMFLLLGDGEI